MIKDWIRDITSLGSLPIYLVIILLTLALKQTIIAIQLTISIIIALIIIYIIRIIYPKQRPNPEPYKNIIEKIDTATFPSAHAARAAILGLLITLNYQNKLLIILAWSIAAIICTTRIRLKKHYTIDIAVGIIIGLISAYLSTILAQFL